MLTKDVESRPLNIVLVVVLRYMLTKDVESHPLNIVFVVVLRYMLTKDVSSRPDIFQVASIAFCLAERGNPIANAAGAEVPDIDVLCAELLTPDGEDEST